MAESPFVALPEESLRTSQQDLFVDTPKPKRPFRIIAQDVFTRQFIHWDLPLDNVRITYSLTGPNILHGVLSTEIKSMLELDPPLIPDRTILYAEEDDIIRGAFIMTPPVDDNAGSTRQIEAEGFSVYPAWVYYMGPPITAIQIDPSDVIRYLWSHCQGFPDGNIRVAVDDISTPKRIGVPSGAISTFISYHGNPTSDFSLQIGEPYSLNIWSGINVGDEIIKLCKETPIEFIERFGWNSNKTDVNLRLELGYPRVGTRRNDIVFKEGVNLSQVVPSYRENNDTYASDVLVLGNGEGRGSIQATAQKRIGRLRKVALFQDQDIIMMERAQAIANFEMNKLGNSRFEIEYLIIDLTHEATPYGSFNAGDDVWVDGTVKYAGRVQGWYRITEWEYDPYSRLAYVSILPSESFSYGAENTDPIDEFPTSGGAYTSRTNAPSEDDEIDNARWFIELLCQSEFNAHGLAPGWAICYLNVGVPTIRYTRLLSEVIDPIVLVVGRTESGHLIAGPNTRIIGPTGTIGVFQEQTATTAKLSTAPLPGPTPAPAPAQPTVTSLMQAGRELLDRFNRGGQIYEDFTYNGYSANLKYWNDHIADMYWDEGGRSLGMGGFLQAVANGTRT